MGKLPLIHEDSKLLRKACFLCGSISPVLLRVIRDMKVTMAAHGAIGIAAPQVGYNIKVFIMRLDGVSTACIDPDLQMIGDATEAQSERCLSLPGRAYVVERHCQVQLTYTDERGKRISRTLSGLVARIAQHEYDHLQGVMIDTRGKEIKPRA